MQPSIIVWDLETVPDLGGFAAANDLIGKSDVEVREAIGEKFPKHIYHSIVPLPLATYPPEEPTGNPHPRHESCADSNIPQCRATYFLP
jgi:hypothetical protein